MGKITTFENEFTTLCELLGENSSKLFEKMGQYDDIDQNEHRAFISYKKNYSQFGYNDESIFTLCMPKIDSFGHRFETTDEYYTYKGLQLGMSKDEVADLWGEHEGEFYWRIERIRIHNGNDIDIYIEFTQRDEEIEEYYLSGFEARLIEKEIEVQYEKQKSGCFVATACYGDYDATEVLLLRNYRDTVLLKTTFGRSFVSIYYILSPPIARFIDKSELLKAFIRKNILAPIISKIKKNK